MASETLLFPVGVCLELAELTVWHFSRFRTGLIPKYALRYVILNLSTQDADEVDSMLDVVPGDFMTFPQLFKVFQDNKPNISENPKVMSRILYSKNLRNATSAISGQDSDMSK